MDTEPTYQASSLALERGRKSRSDGEQSRERLLLAAMRLFGQQGFSKTSTRQIAQAANANVGAISYHFGDKAGLYEACFVALCTPNRDNIALYDQPHFTLRQSLSNYYQQMFAPLLAGEGAEQLVRILYREILEPTGIWQRLIETNIKPEYMAIVAILCRHLGLDEPDQKVHVLAYAVSSLGAHMVTWREVVKAITPDMMATPEAINAWVAQLVDIAEVMVESENARRKALERPE